ncbi:MAG TPA: FHA domain-containing protein, partial [Pseudobdellovibrionaceae bacterium]
MLNTVCHYTVTVHRKDQTMIKIVNEDSFTIGRSLDCTIPLPEDSISRVHLIVHRRQEQIWIEDKGSSNGTFVNNIRIAQNSLVNIAPSDLIRIGKSDYVVCISLEIEERGDAAVKDINNTDATDVLASPQSTKNQQKSTLQSIFTFKEKKPDLKEEIKQEVKYEAPAHNNNPPQYEAEKILHEAHKKAAQIIYNGELQAEKRSQVIYAEARERQAQAESFYQKKIQEAHKEADKILLDFEQQGKGLLEQARQFAQEIRNEVDAFSRTLREKAWREAEEVGIEARKEVEVFKQEAYEKARRDAETEAAELIVKGHEECKNLLKLA